MLISQQHQWGKVQTKVSLGQPRQDKARVKESRYVIKVMRDENRGGLEPLVCQNQRMYRTF